MDWQHGLLKYLQTQVAYVQYQAQDSLITIKDGDSGDADGRKEGMSVSVIAHGDSTPVLSLPNMISILCRWL